MWEAWSVAPRRAKLLNLLILTLTTLTILSCFTAFGAELFTAHFSPSTSPPARLTLRFYYDRIESQLGHSHFADLEPPPYDARNYCTAGGRMLVAFEAVAFIALTGLLALAGCRLSSARLGVAGWPAVWLSAGRSVRLESALSVLCAPLLLAAVASYGGLCFRPLQTNVGFAEVRATGYAYAMAGLLMAVLQAAVYWLVRRDEQCWLGIAEDSPHWASTAHGPSDGYQDEKLSGFDERKDEDSSSSDVEEGGEVDDERERQERQPKRSRHKSHHIKGKHRGRDRRVKIEMKPIDPDYRYIETYGATYQTAEQ